MLIGVVLIALAGELSALEALQYHRNGAAFEDSLVKMAVAFPAFFVFVPVIAPPLSALIPDLPPWLRMWGPRLAGLFVVIAIFMFFAFGIDPLVFLGVVGILCFVGPQIALLLRPSWEAKRGDSPESQGGTSSGLPPRRERESQKIALTLRLPAMPKDAKEKARAEVKRAQSKFADIDSERDQARIARREAFERAREAGLTLREIGEAAGLHLTRVREVLDRD